MKKIKELQKKLAELRKDGNATQAEISKIEAQIAAAEAAGNAVDDKTTAKLEELNAKLDGKDGEDGIIAQIEAAQAELEAEYRAHQRRAALAGASAAPLIGSPMGAMAGTPGFGVGESAVDGMCGFTSPAEFGVAVFNASMAGGDVDERLGHILAAAPDGTHSTGGSRGEGWLVPPEMRTQIMDVAFGAPTDVIGLFNPMPTGSNSVTEPIDKTTPWSPTGVKAFFRSEMSKMNLSEIDLDGWSCKLNELYAFVLASQELIEDAPRLNTYLTQKAGEAIGYRAGEAVLFDDSAGVPLGCLVSNACVTIAKESGQAAASVVQPNVDKMYSRGLGRGTDSFFLAGRDTIGVALPTLNDEVRRDVYKEGGGPQGSVGLLRGIPVYEAEQMLELGQPGDLALINPKGYGAFKKGGGVEYAESIHLYFDHGLKAFRWTFRLGGRPYLDGPVASDKSKPTRSHFLKLALRS